MGFAKAITESSNSACFNSSPLGILECTVKLLASKPSPAHVCLRGCMVKQNYFCFKPA